MEDICRKLGATQATFYHWQQQFGHLSVMEVRELRQLKDENARLKQLVAELSLDRHMLQEVISKSFKACSEERGNQLVEIVFQNQRQMGLPFNSIPESLVKLQISKACAGLSY